MAYSESLARRVRERMTGLRGLTERRLFGGYAFLLNGNLAVGIWKHSLIVRLDPAEYGEVLQQEYVREFDITGRPMKGWVLVEPEGVESDEQLQRWVERSLEFVRLLPGKSPKKLASK